MKTEPRTMTHDDPANDYLRFGFISASLYDNPERPLRDILAQYGREMSLIITEYDIAQVAAMYQAWQKSEEGKKFGAPQTPLII